MHQDTCSSAQNLVKLLGQRSSTSRVLSSENTSIPNDLDSPVVRLDEIGSQLFNLVLEAKREDIGEIVIRSLSFLSVGESSGLDT